MTADAVTITIGKITFDHATYDDRGDVLYLHVGDRWAAADSLGTPGAMPSATTLTAT